MRGRAMHGEVLPERALFGDADTIVGKLPVLELVVATLGEEVFDVLESISVTIHERHRATAIELFVRVGDEDDVTIERNAATLEGNHRHEMDDSLALHVERATSI